MRYYDLTCAVRKADGPWCRFGATIGTADNASAPSVKYLISLVRRVVGATDYFEMYNLQLTERN